MIGNVIKQLRKEKHITQSDLAKIIGVTTSSVGMYETGVRNPSYEVIVKIAKYFNVSTDYLLNNTDNTIDKQASNIKLNKKDEKDIRKALSETLKQLENSQDGLMFDGEPMDDETRELLRISLENSMRIAKQAAKKYTPKKYRK